ncbi:LysR family transcriptional regulator [Nesterenkonia cremea]|uniref:LysR family transcriptional regulator n=1 Tax=Nesterenkonia cremea TaxID=1882340 RepID=A0A917ERX3_9MICC|nr:LysR family transcriptional regulator [Nesterenkonia cremea]GGE71756.1 LysR family transcriptional regulator [Nesterenkonia cremea]
METRLLRYFAAVAEEGTVSGAAATLHITQPSLSRQLRLLEQHLGLKLFQRSGVRLVLTSEGREFLSVAHQVLQKHHDAEQIAETLAAGRLRRLAIAAPRTTLIDIVAPFIATFTPADPVPEVSETAVEPELHPASGDYDLIISPHPAGQGHPAGSAESPDASPAEHITSRPLASLPVWAYIPSDHPLADSRQLTMEELCAHPVVAATREFKSRQLLDAALSLAELRPAELLEVTHGRLAQAMAAAGRGVAVVSDDPHFDLIPLQILHEQKPLRINLSAAWRADHHAADALHAMAQRLQEFCTARYGPTLAD